MEKTPEQQRLELKHRDTIAESRVASHELELVGLDEHELQRIAQGFRALWRDALNAHCRTIGRLRGALNTIQEQDEELRILNNRVKSIQINSDEMYLIASGSRTRANGYEQMANRLKAENEKLLADLTEANETVTTIDQTVTMLQRKNKELKRCFKNEQERRIVAEDRLYGSRKGREDLEKKNRDMENAVRLAEKTNSDLIERAAKKDEEVEKLQQEMLGINEKMRLVSECEIKARTDLNGARATIRNLTKDSYRIMTDGDKWCAQGPGFENIQESPVGFGETPSEALIDLGKDEERHRRATPAPGDHEATHPREAEDRTEISTDRVDHTEARPINEQYPNPVGRFFKTKNGRFTTPATVANQAEDTGRFFLFFDAEGRKQAEEAWSWNQLAKVIERPMPLGWTPGDRIPLQS